MKREILFLAHRIPFPPNRGDKIRSHHLLRRLARIAPVHVATFADDDQDAAQEVELASIAASYRLVRRSKPLIVAGLKSVVTGLPVSLHAFHDPTLAAYVSRTLRERPIGTIFVFSGQMGQYVPDDFAGRVIVDFVDVDSVKFEAYAERPRPVIDRLYAREARLLRKEEARLARRAEVSLLISAEEAALFTSRLSPEEREHVDVRVLPNGIDSDFYDRARVDTEPQLDASGGPRLIFTGQMDYPPNVEAVMRAALRIMPLVREQLPCATFHVVGRNPTDQVKQLDGVNGTRIWGAVADIRPWLKSADMALVPLEIGRGVQNKVLEAMAMCLPVVLTPAAATGIPARDGEQFLIANSDAELAEQVRKLAADGALVRAVGEEARAFVASGLSWRGALAGLADMVGPRRTAGDTAGDDGV